MNNNTSELDLLMVREGAERIHYVAFQNYNLVFEGPQAVPQLNDFLTEFDRLEKCLSDGAARPDKKALIKFGMNLADALFPGEIRRLVTVKPKTSMQVGICTLDPVLKRVPWEFLVWPNDKDAPNERRSIARIVPVSNAEDDEPPAITGDTLRVCLIAAAPWDNGFVDWPQLKKSLEETFQYFLDARGIAKKVTIDVIEGATKSGVAQTLGAADYDVIHFIGHGEPDGLVMVDLQTNKSQLAATSAVSKIFGRTSASLVILTACNTGKQKPGTLSTLAEYLVSDGFPAVVGHQFPLPSNSMVAFCTGLYQILLKTGDIDKAVAAGRVALGISLDNPRNDDASIEWGIPVLYRRPRRAKLFSRG